MGLHDHLSAFLGVHAVHM